MSDRAQRAAAEQSYLRGPAATPVPAEAWNVRRAVVRCDPEQSSEVLNRIRVVMTRLTAQTWPLSLDDALAALPAWFVSACLPPGSYDSDEDAHTAPWPIDNWLAWFRPDEREWHLVAGQAKPHELHLWLAVDDVPFLAGAFEWLCVAAGGLAVDVAF